VRPFDPGRHRAEAHLSGKDWAELRAALAVRLGHPLGQHRHANDLWIATCAVHYGVPLVTGTVRHFDGLPGPQVIPAIGAGPSVG
jgi:predicted nucleic acid-binding protein